MKTISRVILFSVLMIVLASCSMLGNPSDGLTATVASPVDTGNIQPTAIVQTVAPVTVQPEQPTATKVAPTKTAVPTATEMVVDTVKFGWYDWMNEPVYDENGNLIDVRLAKRQFVSLVDERLRFLNSLNIRIQYDERDTTVIDGVTYVLASVDYKVNYRFGFGENNKKAYVELSKIVVEDESEAVTAWNKIMSIHDILNDNNRSFRTSTSEKYDNVSSLTIRYVSHSKLEEMETEFCGGMRITYLPIYTYLNGHIVKHGIFAKDITNDYLVGSHVYGPLVEQTSDYEVKKYVHNAVGQIGTFISFSDSVSNNTYMNASEWLSLYRNDIKVLTPEKQRVLKCLGLNYYTRFIESKGEEFTLFFPAGNVGTSDFIVSTLTENDSEELSLLRKVK